MEGARKHAIPVVRGTDLHADILKVGHHGSRYASTPAFTNQFGHPAPSTLETLRTSSASVYRTDRCGATTLLDNVTVNAMLPCAQ
jgi:competence protein ComEC